MFYEVWRLTGDEWDVWHVADKMADAKKLLARYTRGLPEDEAKEWAIVRVTNERLKSTLTKGPDHE